VNYQRTNKTRGLFFVFFLKGAGHGWNPFEFVVKTRKSKSGTWVAAIYLLAQGMSKRLLVHLHF
jgi:hypothetical protein